jgi:hypothetical protein
MDLFQHLAAAAAYATRTLRVAFALECRRRIASQSVSRPAAGNQHGVGQRSPGSSLGNARSRRFRMAQPKSIHGGTPLCVLASPGYPITLLSKKKDGNFLRHRKIAALTIRRIQMCFHFVKFPYKLFSLGEKHRFFYDIYAL